jgi:hypothetical protein
MDSNNEAYVSGERSESDIAATKQVGDEALERDRRGGLWAWTILGLLICIAPALSSLLAMAFALALGCDSVSFNEQHVPLCSTGNNSQIYALGFLGQYGWVFSLPAGSVVLLVGLIGYAAAEKAK